MFRKTIAEVLVTRPIRHHKDLANVAVFSFLVGGGGGRPMLFTACPVR